MMRGACFAMVMAVAIAVAAATELDAPNLCLPAEALTFSGSLANFNPLLMFSDGTPLATMLVPPHDLIIEWPAPVTFDTHRVRWERTDFCASHYGLEYWDEGATEYRLAYSATSNADAVVTHKFTPVTARRVRFTVFRHPWKYRAVVIREFGLYLTPPVEDDKATP